MPKVMIDGIEYAPKCEILELTDDRLSNALKILTAMLYFRETHKAMTHAWEVLNDLSPELAKLAEDSPKAAYDMVHTENAEFFDKTIEELENTVIKIEPSKCGKYDLRFYFFELTTRSLNGLKSASPQRCMTLSELLEHRSIDLLKLPLLGKKSVNEINESLKRASLATGFNFSLRDGNLPISPVVRDLFAIRESRLML